MMYVAYICLDNNRDTNACTSITPSAGIYGWSFSTSVFSGYNAKTTVLHLAVYIYDGTTGNILQAVKPPAYLTPTGRNFTVGYTY